MKPVFTTSTWQKYLFLLFAKSQLLLRWQKGNPCNQESKVNDTQSVPHESAPRSSPHFRSASPKLLKRCCCCWFWVGFVFSAQHFLESNACPWLLQLCLWCLHVQVLSRSRFIQHLNSEETSCFQPSVAEDQEVSVLQAGTFYFRVKLEATFPSRPSLA